MRFSGYAAEIKVYCPHLWKNGLAAMGCQALFLQTGLWIITLDITNIQAKRGYLTIKAACNSAVCLKRKGCGRCPALGATGKAGRPDSSAIIPRHAAAKAVE